MMWQFTRQLFNRAYPSLEEVSHVSNLRLNNVKVYRFKCTVCNFWLLGVSQSTQWKQKTLYDDLMKYGIIKQPLLPENQSDMTKADMLPDDFMF